MSVILPPPRSILFPYTTLFRSSAHCNDAFHESSEVSRSVPHSGNPAPDPDILSYTLHRRLNSEPVLDRKSTRLNSSHVAISFAVFCLQKQRREAQVTKQHHLHH